MFRNIRLKIAFSIKLPWILRYCFAIVLVSNLACTPMIHPAGLKNSSGDIENNIFTTTDGAKLPFKTWLPTQKNIDAIIIALHGFNDYSNFFQLAGEYFSQHNKVSYAYDQRGFGNSPNHGLWAGIETYTSDLQCFIHLIKNKHPLKPIYLLGESMGGAIVISTIAQAKDLPIAGVILSAPAVWARSTMPWYQNVLLWTLSHTFPWVNLSGSGVGIKPSDNIEMLRALGRDPLIIKETRIETIFGLVNLMDDALSKANNITLNTLLLYGEKDQIIPMKPTEKFLNNMLASGQDQYTIAFYKEGYHMLLRDLQASVLWNDINLWIKSSQSPLPSGADKRAKEVLKN